MAIKYIAGKVYLRDRRNGRVYEYEHNLAQSKNIDSFTYEEPEAPKPQKAPKKAASEEKAADKTD